MGRKLSFYKRIRTVLVATNKKSDNTIIACGNAVKALANDKGENVSGVIKSNGRTLVRGKSVNLNRTTADRRKGN